MNIAVCAVNMHHLLVVGLTQQGSLLLLHKGAWCTDVETGTKLRHALKASPTLATIVVEFTIEHAPIAVHHTCKVYSVHSAVATSLTHHPKS